MVKTELRYAIWVAYSKKDAYGRGLIEDFNDLEIDHIIPKSIDEVSLSQKIAKYNLGEDFNFDSIENLIPTSKSYNRLKEKIILDESHERYFLAIAKGKKERVEKELAAVNKKSKLKEKAQFGEVYKITDSDLIGIKPSYSYSKSLVALNAYLPSRFDGMGSCAIEFYEIGLMITLNHKILSMLIEKEREFTIEEQIVQYYDEKNGRAFVIVGTSTLHLKKEAYEQFVVILKDFLGLYKQYHERFLSFFELHGFEELEASQCYILDEIGVVDWERLFSYSQNHSSPDEPDNDFYFAPNPNALIAIDNNESVIKFIVTYHTIFTSSKIKTVLLWHLPELNARKFVEKGTVFTASNTLNWIRNTLIEQSSNVENGGEIKMSIRKPGHISSIMKRLRLVLQMEKANH